MSQVSGENVRKSEGVPEGLRIRCPDCGGMLFKKAVEDELHVCPECQYHFRVSAALRVKMLTDPETFEELFADIEPVICSNSSTRKPTRTACASIARRPVTLTPFCAAKPSSRAAAGYRRHGP